jgi:uncharacterized membrane protein YcaP (DUF421 family)
MEELWKGLESLFGVGLDARSLNPLQGGLRALLAYAFALLLLRLSRNRSLAKHTGFDVVLAFVLGSVLSRGINGPSSISVAFAASAVLVGLHQLFARASSRSPRFERLIDGHSEPVVHEGKVLEDALRRRLVSYNDLCEALRLKGFKSPSQAEEARVERNGEISVIPKPRVVEVKVEDGVQTVRIEIA